MGGPKGPPPAKQVAPKGPAVPVNPSLITVGDISKDRFIAAFNNSGLPMREFSPRWWFEYFMYEARIGEGKDGASLTPGGNRRAIHDMVDVANTIFFKKPLPRGDFELELHPHMKKWNTPTPGLNGEPGRGGVDTNQIWKEALTKLLKIGFRAVSKGEVAPDGVQMLELDETRAPQHMLQQRMLGKKIAELEKKMAAAAVPIYWRSETRDLKRIISQGGTKRQCDVESIAQDMNMTAPWHPFSDPALSKYMWFRLSNKDNDYYTVISVATSFQTACGFPKINEKRVYQFPPAQVANWSKSQADRFKSNLGLVMESGRETVRVITTTTTYMLVHTGSVLDTMGANSMRTNEGFPEIGVDYIPLDNIYCVLPIRRVHHGLGEGDGFTVFIDRAKCERLHSGKEIDLFGLKLSSRLFDMYLDTRSSPPFATAWSKTGAAAPGIPANIQRIIEFPISDGKFQAFRATLADSETVKAIAAPISVSENMKAVLAQLPRKV